MGRPFTLSSGKQLLADMDKNSSEASWCTVSPQLAPKKKQNYPKMSTIVVNPNSTGSKERFTEAAERWTQDGRAEHASVASFSRFSLQLMAVAAPSYLLEAAHLAAMDEISHAQLCFSLAREFSSAYGEDSVVTPGAFKIPSGSVDVSGDIGELVLSTAMEGCVGETVSTVQAQYELQSLAELEQVGVFGVGDVLSVIFRDEARHSALAWRTVQWALSEERSPDAATAREQVLEVLQILKAEVARTKSQIVLSPPAFVGAELPLATKKALRALTLQHLVVPSLQRLLDGRSLDEGALGLDEAVPESVKRTYQEMWM